MRTSPDFLEFLLDQLRPLGPLTKRRIFGCACLYCDGRMFAIVTPEDRLYFKGDGKTKPRFEAAGYEPFTDTVSGRVTTMGYSKTPDAALGDPEEMLAWARLAIEAAKRAPERSPRKSRSLRRRKGPPHGPGD